MNDLFGKYQLLTDDEKLELKAGDVCYIGTSRGILEGVFPEILSKDSHTNLWGGDTIKSKVAYADLFKLKENEKK